MQQTFTYGLLPESIKSKVKESEIIFWIQSNGIYPLTFRYLYLDVIFAIGFGVLGIGSLVMYLIGILNGTSLIDEFGNPLDISNILLISSIVFIFALIGFVSIYRLIRKFISRGDTYIGTPLYLIRYNTNELDLFEWKNISIWQNSKKKSGHLLIRIYHYPFPVFGWFKVDIVRRFYILGNSNDLFEIVESIRKSIPGNSILINEDTLLH